MDNIGEMEKFPEIHNLSRLTQEEIENMNRTITRHEIESIIKKKKKTQQESRARWLHR